MRSSLLLDEELDELERELEELDELERELELELELFLLRRSSLDELDELERELELRRFLLLRLDRDERLSLRRHTAKAEKQGRARLTRSRLLVRLSVPSRCPTDPA